MATDGLFLEDSDGGQRANPSEAEIKAMIERIGDSLDHCILHLPGGAFVQTAGGRNRLFIEYGDASGLFGSTKTDFDAATVAGVFAAAMAGNGAWKGQYVFEKTGEAQRGAETSPAGGSMKDQLLGSVKRELNREASRGIGKLVRKGIRSFTGRR